MSAVLAQRRITEDSHQRFAELSGDLNPLHVDREASKLMPPGQRLAYGMDLLLWSLESLAQKGEIPEQLARVRVRFPKWVFIEDVVALRRTAHPSGNLYELVVNEATVTAFDLQTGARQNAVPFDCPSVPTARRAEPMPRLLEEMEGQQGLVPVADASRAAAMFPLLTKRFGGQWVSECATCSYVIGMEAPGLYSMSLKYDLHFYAAPRVSACMHYKVVAADERFRKIRIAIDGAAICATLEALVREP